MESSLLFKHQIPIPDSIKDSRKKHVLTYLLPYDPSKKYVNGSGLKEYKMLLLAAKEAITEFLNGNWSSFDSLVGENSCQIRATLLSLIAQAPNEKIDLLRQITHVIEKMEAVAPISENQTLNEYLEKHGLEIHLTFREVFLIGSYILTKVRVLLPPDAERRIVRNEITDTKKIKEISAVGSSFARDLVKRLRALIARDSVVFVQDIAELLPIPESVADMVSDTYCMTHDKFGKLKCLPCFWYTLVLMKYATAIELPVVLTIKQIASDKNYSEIHSPLLLHFKVIDGRYREVPSHLLAPEAPALVIFASCCRQTNAFGSFENWKEEFLGYDLSELILAYAAAHRQYPDESKDAHVRNASCDFYHHYKSKALEWGCSLENPSLFFLVHAYCDKVKNVPLQEL